MDKHLFFSSSMLCGGVSELKQRKELSGVEWREAEAKASTQPNPNPPGPVGKTFSPPLSASFRTARHLPFRTGPRENTGDGRGRERGREREGGRDRGRQRQETTRQRQKETDERKRDRRRDRKSVV